MGRKFRRERKVKKKIDYATIICIIYFVVLFLLYKTDEIILFNVKWWYYAIFYTLHVIIIFIVLNIPNVNLHLFKKNEFKSKFFVSLLTSFFISLISYFGVKCFISNVADETFVTENCEILEIKKTSYRRGGDYYVIRTIFKGKEERIDLNEKLYTELKEINISKNHAIIKVKPSIFDIYVVDNIHIQSKNIPN